MTSLVSIDEILFATEERVLSDPNGAEHHITMNLAMWTAFDDLMDAGNDQASFVEWAISIADERGETALGDPLAEAVMWIHQRRAENDRTIAEFNRYCAEQSRSAAGMREIRTEASRIKSENVSRRLSE